VSFLVFSSTLLAWNRKQFNEFAGQELEEFIHGKNYQIMHTMEIGTSVLERGKLNHDAPSQFCTKQF
jgi:hypothetical protein